MSKVLPRSKLADTKLVASEQTVVNSLSRYCTPALEDAGVAAVRVLYARMNGHFSPENQVTEYFWNIWQFSEMVARGMARADVESRLALVKDAELNDALDGENERRWARGAFAPADLPEWFKVPFPQAVENLANRNPVVAPGWRATAQAYQRQSFALAKSTNLSFTKIVQAAVKEGMEKGRGVEAVVEQFRMEGLSDEYAENVYRTNVKTASMAGRLQQAQSPALKNWIMGWQYFAKRDSRVRPTHLAMHSKCYAVQHPVWQIWVPPNGYQCRCTIIEITRPSAKDMGRLDADGVFRSDADPDVRPDEGFANRPDSGLYAGVG